MSITPGLRYDWQNALSSDRNNFSPRFSFAWAIDPKTKTVLRGGGGIYFDRVGSSPILDLARYQYAKRRVLQISSNQEPLCYPIAACIDPDSLPPSLAEYAPGIRTPYRVYYGLSLERQIGEKATITIGGRSQHGVGMFRSIDINAPLAESDYTVRPDPNYSQVRQIQSEGTQDGDSLDINYRGRFNRWFNAFAWYTWSHYDNNTSGIYFFPENQQDPSAEWGRADWDRPQRFGIYGEINGEHLLNLGFGIFAHSVRLTPSLPGPTRMATTFTTHGLRELGATARPGQITPISICAGDTISNCVRARRTRARHWVFRRRRSTC